MRELARKLIPLSWRRAAMEALRTTAGRRTLRRARRALRRFTEHGAPPPARIGADSETAQAVVVCLWHRPGRLRGILEELAAQIAVPPLHLVLWNNDASNDAAYREAIADGARGAIARIDLITSPVNIGGAARMIAADFLSDYGYAGSVVLIDDDQQVGREFVATLRAAWSPKTYAGVWAWRIHGDYWDRSPSTDGETATYVGTGGSIVDLDLLTDRRLRAMLDSEDLMLEDILLSSRAHALGYAVRGVDAPYVFVEEEQDQWHALADLKPALYARLGRFASFPRSADA